MSDDEIALSQRATGSPVPDGQEGADCGEIAERANAFLTRPLMTRKHNFSVVILLLIASKTSETSCQTITKTVVTDR